MKRKLQLIWVLCLLLAGPGQAQDRYAVSAGFGRQKVGLPLVDLLGFPPHTSIQVEGSRKYGEAGDRAWYQTLAVMTFDNTSAGSGYLVQSHFGKNIPLGKSLVFRPEAGLALTHRFHPSQGFVFRDGHFVWDKDYGKVRPAIQTRTSLGYQSNRITLLVSWQLSADLFYRSGFPFLPVNYLHLGVMYHFGKDPS